MKILRRIGISLLITSLLIVSSWSLRPAFSQDLGRILVLGGIVLAVSTFGGQINSFINNSLNQNQAAAVGATKVVPIISVGRGLYVGAAQVMGVPAGVSRTQVVASVNVTIGNLTGSALVPISTRVPGSTLARVEGVGVSAVISFHI